MGRAREHWERFTAGLEKADIDGLEECFAADAVWYEPQNPVHETDKLIAAYLNSWLSARENVDISTKRILESEDGAMAAIEYTISYTAAGRRWNSLPRSTWIEVGDRGITYQRDYY